MNEKDNQSKDNEIILIPNEIEEPDKEKKRLIQILSRIKEQLEQKDKNKISDVYISYSAEQFSENKEIKRKKTTRLYRIGYKFVLFLITSIYLVGSFIIASMKKSFQNLLLMSLRCRLDAFCDKEEFKKRANFYEYFHVQLLTEPVDLNLIMFWNFIGIKLLNSIGYRPTSLIFLVLNFLILLLTFFIQYDEYEPDTCQYSYPNIILIFFNWVFMAVFFGGSSLLAQQKLIDYYSLLDPSKEEEKNSYNLINSSAEND